MTQYLTAPVVAREPGNAVIWTLSDTVANLSAVTAAGYLTSLQNLGMDFQPQDSFYINYVGGSGFFLPTFSGNIITLSTLPVGPISAIGGMQWIDVSCSAAALASAGKVNIQVSSGSQQYSVRDIRVNYSASGLSGGGGNRLLVVSDATTVFNNAGITAALLGTPVNTLFGGSGNPVAGTVAQNTRSTAGANIYAQYSGGTTDYTTGSVSLSVLVQRVA